MRPKSDSEGGGENARAIAEVGAKVGAAVGGRVGPVTTGVTSGLGGAVGYLAGAAVDEVYDAADGRAMTDGGRPNEGGVAIDVSGPDD